MAKEPFRLTLPQLETDRVEPVSKEDKQDIQHDFLTEKPGPVTHKVSL